MKTKINSDVRDLFGRNLSPALKDAAKSEGVTVGTLMLRIQREYATKLGGRVPAWLRNECYSEWLGASGRLEDRQGGALGSRRSIGNGKC